MLKIASILLRVLFVRSVYAFCSQFRRASLIWTSRVIGRSDSKGDCLRTHASRKKSGGFNRRRRMNDVDNGRDEHVWIHGLSDVRLKTGAFSARYVFLGSFDERGNKVRRGCEISSWMSVRILVRSGIKSGTTRHAVCSASPAVKRALIEFWSVFSSRMILGKAQAYFISPFVKCPQIESLSRLLQKDRFA